jgi:hypothetical protein
MANRFLNNIRINDEYTFPENDGSAGQAIVTDGSGNLSFGSAVASSADSTKSVHINVKNTSGSQILKGTPVYVTGETGNSGKIEIAPADASDSAKMPALGILESTLNDNAEGFCVQGGLLEGLATATIDGTSTTANDTVYVKAGGGLTMTKPTGSNLIQNIAKVARVHASNGSLVVSSILRTNDVPNLPTGKIWVGDGNTTISTVVHLDESNGRMGIGTNLPTEPLDVRGSVKIGKDGTSPYLTFDEAPDSIAGSEFYLTHDIVGNILKFTDDNSNDFIAMDRDTGYVGIGTTSPDKKFQVSNGTQTFSISPHSTGIDLHSTGNIAPHYQTNFTLYTGAIGSGSAKVTVDSSGNVGIATTNPENKLHVQQPSAYTGIHTTAGIRIKSDAASSIGSYHGTIALSRGTGSVAISAVQEATDSDVMGMAFFTHPSATGGDASVEQMRIDQNGNVGIGTTDPSRQLHVSGSTFGAVLISGVASDAFSEYDDGTNVWKAGIDYSQSAYRITHTNFNGAGISLDSSGNLTVDGDAKVAGAYYDSNNSAGTSGQVLSSTATGTDWVSLSEISGVDGTGTANYVAKWSDTDTITNSVIYDNGTNVGIGTTNPANGGGAAKWLTLNGQSGSPYSGGIVYAINDSVKAYHYVQDTFLIHQGQSGIGHRFFANGSEKMRITTDGYVGVGVTIPGAKLDIAGTNSTLALSYGNTVPNNPLHTNYYGGFSGIGMDSATAGVRIVGDSNTLVMDVGYYTSGVPQHANWNSLLKVLSNGNVGIGTTSPTLAKLEVRDSSTQPGLLITSDGGNEQFKIQRYSNNNEQLILGFHSSDYAQIQAVEQGVAYRTLALNPNGGNVGIGLTDTNSVKLGITGNSGLPATSGTTQTALLRLKASNNATLDMGADHVGAKGWLQVTDVAALNLYYDLLLQPNGGNVGIGTTDPGEKLSVGGNIALVSNNSFISFNTSASSGDPKIQMGSDGDFSFLNTAGSNNLHIENGGNVGINETNPSQKLHVNGNLRVTGFYYDSNNSTGTPGQVLSSTSGGTDWVDNTPSTAAASSLYDLLPNGRFTTTYAFTSTAGTWATVTSGNSLITSNGSYIVQAYVNDFAVGGTQYTEFYSGVMSWWASSTNDTGGGTISEITLHRAGHAANSGNIYLRTRETISSEGNVLKLEIMCNKTYSGASNIVFKFVRII